MVVRAVLKLLLLCSYCCFLISQVRIIYKNQTIIFFSRQATSDGARHCQPWGAVRWSQGAAGARREAGGPVSAPATAEKNCPHQDPTAGGEGNKKEGDRKTAAG